MTLPQRAVLHDMGLGPYGMYKWGHDKMGELNLGPASVFEIVQSTVMDVFVRHSTTWCLSDIYLFKFVSALCAGLKLIAS